MPVKPRITKIVSVIIPARKQEKNILKSVIGIDEAMSKIRFDYEIIVVVDGKSGSSYDEIRKIKRKKVQVLGYSNERGRGYALKYGTARSRGDYVVFLDPGINVNPNGISLMLEHLEWYDADIVVGSKMHPASKVNFPLTRRFYSRVFHMLTKIFLGVGVRDTQVGLKIFRRDVLEKVLPRLVIKKAAFDIEVLSVARYLGFKRIFESPIQSIWPEEDGGNKQPYFLNKNVRAILLETIAIFYRLRILQYYSDKKKRKWFYDKELDMNINTGEYSINVGWKKNIKAPQVNKILWMTWKDKKHPLAGGAEVVNEELAKRLVKDGYDVTILTSGFKDCERDETINGYRVIRVGSLMSVYWNAYLFYKKNLIGWADLVIDEINTIPFFCKFYVKEKNIIFIHQLCREIWFYGMQFPISLFGYLVEPLYLRLLSNVRTITISESTRLDLSKHGFNNDKISLIPEGLEFPPISEQEYKNTKKENNPTMIYLGSIRKMKRPKHVLKAFELARSKIPNLKFFIVGHGKNQYASEFFRDVKYSKYAKDIKYFGRVSNKRKMDLLKKSHVICVTSVKEGWGLIVTEANSCGTPAIVYDVDGLRDSCKNRKTGIVCGPTPYSMALGIIKLFNNRELYDKYRYNSWKDSFNYNYDKTYKKFLKIINE
mgnify:CR=1 FL=1